MKAEKKLKKFNETQYKQELKQLEVLKNLLAEKIDLLNQLDSKTIVDFEENINSKSGFVNAMMSATAYGKEVEYRRLLELEKEIDGKINADDLTKEMSFKKSFLNKLKDKHSTFYTPAELSLLSKLKDVSDAYNSLTIEERSQLAINRAGMVINPFSYLLR